MIKSAFRSSWIIITFCLCDSRTMAADVNFLSMIGYEIRVNCHDYMINGFTKSGFYFIDPDGTNYGLDPFKVYCDLRTGASVLQPEKDEYDMFADISEMKPINYVHGPTSDQINGLKAVSLQCQQYQHDGGICKSASEMEVLLKYQVIGHVKEEWIKQLPCNGHQVPFGISPIPLQYYYTGVANRRDLINIGKDLKTFSISDFTCTGLKNTSREEFLYWSKCFKRLSENISSNRYI